MQTVNLDERLIHDCHVLGRVPGTTLLLHRNALYPWFILVPDTSETEFYKLNNTQQLEQLQLINTLSEFIQGNFQIDKLNIATIGNVVSQLHIHVIGRRHNDACWPNVVWGVDKSDVYSDSEVTTISAKLAQTLGDSFVDII